MTHLDRIFAGQQFRCVRKAANAFSPGYFWHPGGTAAHRRETFFRLSCWITSLAILLISCMALSGCGSNVAIRATSSGTGTTASGSDGTSSGTGATISASGGTLSGMMCNSSTETGAGSDYCTVTLSAAAGTGGLTMSLSSNNAAVAVPTSATVAAGATSASFMATVSAVGATQTATLTAAASGATESYAVTLNASAAALTLSSGNVSFGEVNLNSPATQTVTLTSSGTAPLTLSAGTATGTGFSMSGVSFPVTLNPGQTAILTLQFNPATAGAAGGAVTLTSNATGGGTATISLSGTGEIYEVQMSWSTPSGSTASVAGYNIYRATAGSSSYQLINPSVDLTTTYTDASVQDGNSYSYYIESVEASGTQSAPSSPFTVNIP